MALRTPSHPCSRSALPVIARADHVTADLVNSFNHGVGLRISRGDEFHSDAIVILEHGEYFPFEFVASIQDYLCRPGIMCKPDVFQGIGNLVGASIGDLNDLEPSSCGIDHGHGMKGDFVFLVPELVGTD